MRISLKKWAENEFKNDSQLNLIPTLYQKLKSDGLDFSDVLSPAPKAQPLSKDPNVVSSQQEEDDIAKAIELSLKDKGDGVKAQSNNSYVSTFTISRYNFLLYCNFYSRESLDQFYYLLIFSVLSLYIPI